jgi:hypothetical protein
MPKQDVVIRLSMNQQFTPDERLYGGPYSKDWSAAGRDGGD